MHKYLFFLLIISPASFASSSQLELPMHIDMTIPRTESSVLRRITESIYNESFRRLGVTVSFSGCVPANCGKHVINGYIDGEAARASIYKRIYPELIQTKESIYTVNVSAFSTDPSIKLTSWDDLKDSHYKVTYIAAYYLIDKKIKELVDPSNIIYTQHWIDGLSKLSNRDADIYIGIETTVLDELKGKKSAIHSVGVLDTIDLYPYFNKKYKLLSEALAGTLKEMKTDGTMEKLFLKY